MHNALTVTPADGAPPFVLTIVGSSLSEGATAALSRQFVMLSSVAPRECARDGGNPYQGRRRADSLVMDATGQSSAA